MTKPSPKISRAIFIQMYMDEKKSGLEIARFFGIGRTTVSRYIDYYGLPHRSISEVRKNNFWRGSNEQYQKVSQTVKKRVGSKHPNWTGDKVKYHALHRWVEKQITKPVLCEHCQLKPPKDLSNKGIYNRDLTNWQWLCRSCHVKYDYTPERAVKQGISLSKTRAERFWSTKPKNN